MSDEATKILNWMDDDYGMEITEGIKFDPENDYTFEVTDIKRKAGEKDGKPWQSLELSFTEAESGVTIRKSFFLNPKISINKDSPEKSADLIKLANALGYKTEIGTKGFHPKNFLRIGLKISARVVEQVRKDGTKTGYSEINIASIRPFGKKAQQSFASDPSDVAKWQKEISDGKYPTKEKYMANLVNTGRATEVGPFNNAVASGEITFQ